jgi:predicted Fe-Mo cluster-binding NifX family protein
MKIGLPSNGKGFLSTLASSFERCNYFVIIDSDKNEVVTNNLNSAQTASRGAEQQAVELIAGEKIDIIITPNIGLATLRTLQNMRIRIYFSIKGTVEGNIISFCQGRLVELIY